MSASFRRKQKREDHYVSTILKGTKPWTGGITLCSVGIRDLDSILGGGQPVGTSLLLEEDRWTRDSALSFVKYWCAEAVSHEQLLLIPTFHDDSCIALPTSALPFNEKKSYSDRHGATSSEISNLIDSLPRNLNWDKAAGKVVEEGEKSRPLEILEEVEEGDSEEGLQIAWQYRKSVQNERLGHESRKENNLITSNVFCHSYDLNGRLCEQNMKRECIQILNDYESLLQEKSSGFRLFQQIKGELESYREKYKGKLIRLLLYKAPIEITAVAMPLLLTYIRSHNLPVVVLVTIHAWACKSQDALVNLRRSSDVVMQTEGFASRFHYPPPAEFRHLHGLLLLPKVSTVTAAASIGHFADMTVGKRPPAHVYGLKRDKRKLHITLLHIPPEEYADRGGSVGGGGVRSGAGLKQDQGGGCSRKEGDLLDF